MKVACENCRTLFRIEDKNLTSKGATVICPKCQHPHLVKRIVIPYGNLKNNDSSDKDDLKKSPSPDNTLENSRTDTFIKKIISRVSMPENNTSDKKSEKIENNPLIETLENGITRNHMNKKLKKEDKKKIKSKKNRPQSGIIELESLESYSEAKEESIISYTDAQKLGDKKKLPDEPSKEISSFLTIVIITLIILGLIGFMIFAIYQKYSGL